jgi:hypothetical protein
MSSNFFYLNLNFHYKNNMGWKKTFFHYNWCVNYKLILCGLRHKCVLYTHIYGNCHKVLNRIGGVIISMPASSAVDRGFELWSSQTKD